MTENTNKTTERLTYYASFDFIFLSNYFSYFYQDGTIICYITNIQFTKRSIFLTT